MKQRLSLLFMLFLSISMYAQRTGFSGIVVDAGTGQPVPGANVMLREQNIYVTSGPAGDFQITNASPGADYLTITSFGYATFEMDINVVRNQISNLGKIKLSPVAGGNYSDDEALITFDESQLDDSDEGGSQSIGNLSGAADDVYLSTTSYIFSPMRFRVRGYDSEYSSTYINGICFNEPSRGRFNYSMLGGMNQAFRNKSITNGIELANFSFGNLGGATNINTRASEYAPGLRASVGFTNRNYKWRGMLTYSTGLMKNGWALTASAIGRFADEGVQPGTFYNSFGYFLSAQKVFNEKHNLTLTTFGAPTQRGQASATYQEAYDLTGDNLYNPNWGWQCGKKRNARIVDSFDPTTLLSWVWKPANGTTVTTGGAFRFSKYANSALNWYNAEDPRPDYYRKLPSYTAAFYGEGSQPVEEVIYQWQHNDAYRQIDWNKMYQANYRNNRDNANEGKDLGSTYIQENRFSNQLNGIFNSTINTRLNDFMTLQGGVGFNYTRASYFKEIKDLLGGEYWLDVDQFAERDFGLNTLSAQNDLNNPDRRVQKGDKFGYDYDINSIQANIWLQNNINLHHWDIYYALELSYTQFQRDGKMRNGRAPENSYGKGEMHRFENGGIKAGFTYKLDGRNFFTVNALYRTEAPVTENAYISPRIKDDAIPDLKSERIVSADASYMFAYRNLKGRITAFQTNFYDQTELFRFYHDLVGYRTFVNYILKDVNKVHRGVELGLAYKVYPGVTASFAGTIARYRYKNRPKGITSFENGSNADTVQTVYMKNFYVGGTPQEAFNIGVDWAAPKLWFLNMNLSYYGKAYVSPSPVRREAHANFPTTGDTEEEIYQNYYDVMKEATTQQKLKGGFMLNASIGKLIYIGRSHSLNINVAVNNILNNRGLQSGGFEQGRFDFAEYNSNKYPDKFYYVQGINVFANIGFKF